MQLFPPPKCGNLSIQVSFSWSQIREVPLYSAKSINFYSIVSAFGSNFSSTLLDHHQENKTCPPNQETCISEIKENEDIIQKQDDPLYDTIGNKIKWMNEE